MLIGPAVLLATLADAPAQAASAANPADRGGTCPAPAPNSTTIVICAERPQGYRLNPDVMEAKREVRSGGRPPRPSTETPPPDCRTVGPTPCLNAGINLLAAAGTAAEMARRIAAGQEVGSMFLTDPHPDEYHLYLMAKARREAEEAETAAKAALAKSKASAAAPSAPPPASGN